jgi:hypothetical protein
LVGIDYGSLFMRGELPRNRRPADSSDFSNILIFLFYVLKKRGYYYRLIAQKSGLKGLKGGFNG